MEAKVLCKYSGYKTISSLLLYVLQALCRFMSLFCYIQLSINKEAQWVFAINPNIFLRLALPSGYQSGAIILLSYCVSTQSKALAIVLLYNCFPC